MAGEGNAAAAGKQKNPTPSPTQRDLCKLQWGGSVTARIPRVTHKCLASNEEQLELRV